MDFTNLKGSLISGLKTCAVAAISAGIVYLQTVVTTPGMELVLVTVITGLLKTALKSFEIKTANKLP